MAFAAVSALAGFGSGATFVASPQQPSFHMQPVAPATQAAQPLEASDFGNGPTPLRVSAFLLSGIGAATLAFAQKRTRRSTNQKAAIVRQCQAYGEELSVPGDSFVVLGLAHCFEQVDGQLQDVYVLEPVAASTVEVVDNGAQTSYETFIGTTVTQVMEQDVSAFPEALLNGHTARFCDNLEFRLGCAARTWMRDHARDVVRNLAPVGEVRTDFNTSVEHKRILNFVHEVKDSDNIKQDMSIDVYGRDEGQDGSSDGVDSQIADLYNV